MARTGLDLLKSLKAEGFVKYHLKDDDSTFYKAKVVSVDIENELAKIIAAEGPRFDEGNKKPFNVHMDRLKGVQGRPSGYSPTNKKGSDEDEDDGDKPAGKTAGKKDTGKKDAAPAKEEKKKGAAKSAEDSPVEFDLESAKKELADAAEELDSMMETLEDVVEMIDNRKASMTALAAFLDSLKMGDEDASPEPEKKTRTRRTRRTGDEDEA